jgi:hypothetical protein
VNPPEKNVTPIEPIVPETPPMAIVPDAPVVPPADPHAAIVPAGHEAEIVPVTHADAAIVSTPPELNTARAVLEAPMLSSASATPVTPAGFGAAVPIGARRPAFGIRQIAVVVAVILVLLLAYKLLHHHRSQYEATADAVTTAIVNNNMTPVEHAFNAARYPELENRVQVARLSDILVPLGKFEGSKEITPAGSAAGLHEFTETFEHGTKFERYELDADGKILHFHIGDAPSTSTSP